MIGRMSINKTKLAHFKERLLEEKKTLLEELSRLGKRNPTTNDWDAVPKESAYESDENDRADRAEQYELDTSIVNTLESRLKDVDDALGKIEKDTYGICEISGEEIEEKRLEANPAARTSTKYMNQ